ncbi:MAG: hypothetical protein RIB80_03430 [Rhodospirillales bacterium]
MSNYYYVLVAAGYLALPVLFIIILRTVIRPCIDLMRAQNGNVKFAELAREVRGRKVPLRTAIFGISLASAVAAGWVVEQVADRPLGVPGFLGLTAEESIQILEVLSLSVIGLLMIFTIVFPLISIGVQSIPQGKNQSNDH